MSSSLTIPTEEQRLILSAIDGLPPSFLLSELNEQQTEHWFKVRQIFDYLHKALKAYFSGESTPLRELPPYDQELFAEMADFYIKLYGVIQWGFQDILEFYAKSYAKYGNKKDYGNVFPCISPGETLAAILERDAVSQFWQCKMGRHDFKPRKMYEMYREEKKLKKGKLNHIEYQNYEKGVKTLTKDFESLMEMEFFCINACRQAAKSRNDKVLSRKIQEYETSREELSKILHRSYREMKGYAWENGKLLETTKKGGTYKASS